MTKQMADRVARSLHAAMHVKDVVAEHGQHQYGVGLFNGVVLAAWFAMYDTGGRNIPSPIDSWTQVRDGLAKWGHDFSSIDIVLVGGRAAN